MSKPCRAKRRYTSRFAALFFGRCDGLRAYPCPECGGWHLTSRDVRRARVKGRSRPEKGRT
jgi:hypothetical protein